VPDAASVRGRAGPTHKPQRIRMGFTAVARRLAAGRRPRPSPQNLADHFGGRPRVRRPLSLLLPILVAALASGGLFGCGSSKKGTATSPTTASVAVASTATGSAASTGPTTPSTGAASISIKNFSFSPVPLSVKAGDTITITNNDSTDHTATDGGGAFDTGHIAPGAFKTVTITKAGTYNYHCNIHPFMKGVINVSP